MPRMEPRQDAGRLRLLTGQSLKSRYKILTPDSMPAFTGNEVISYVMRLRIGMRICCETCPDTLPISHITYLRIL